MNTTNTQKSRPFLTLDKYFIAGFVVYLALGWYLSTSDIGERIYKRCKESEYAFIVSGCEKMKQTTATEGLSIILFLLGSYIWLMLIYYTNTENTTGPRQYGLVRNKLGLSTIFSFLWKVCVLIVAVALLLLLITGVIHVFGEWSNTTSAILTTLNILNVITILAIIYVYFLNNIEWGETPRTVFDLIKNLVFYIPCLYIDMIRKLTGEFERTPRTSVILLIIEAVIITSYFLIPFLMKLLTEEIGDQLLRGPVYLNNQYTLGSYESLNKRTKNKVERERKKEQVVLKGPKAGDPGGGPEKTHTDFSINLENFYLGDRVVNVDYTNNRWISEKMPAEFNYNYALSSWIYINPQPPSTNEHYSKFTRLLDYGGKPSINYMGKTNTLQITMNTEKDGKTVVYEDSKFPLQKWNHILINYDGGTLDVFINNNLVSSTPSIVPYMSYDTVYSGVDNGIHGGICNVTYFDKVLDKTEISLLYETAKLKNPPLL